jgi:ligand-binding SRPBCC domain-containing protein
MVQREGVRGRLYTFETELWLPRPLEEVFAFFSEPRNLETITPAWLHFRILTPQPVQVCRGALIDYRLRLRGLPVRWQTEIAAWDPPYRFVDVQRRGPYRLWIHEHTFEEQGDGTLARDRVDYKVPGGALVHRLLVGRDVSRIFAYRRSVLSHYFGVDGPREPMPRCGVRSKEAGTSAASRTVARPDEATGNAGRII